MRFDLVTVQSWYHEMRKMSGEGYPQSPEPTEAEVRQVVQRILSSKHFSNAPTKQRFLQLIIEAYIDGREDKLNEYMIGCEVYARDETYNPALDPIVRVGAHGLRKKLQSYYKDDGKEDELILEIPVGSYIPIFTTRARPPEAIESTKDIIPKVTAAVESSEKNGIPEKSGNKWISLLSLLIVFLLMTVFALSFSQRNLCGNFEESAVQRESLNIIKPVWNTFLKDESPPIIVLTNPSVFRFSNPGDPAHLSRYSTGLSPAETKSINEIFGPGRFETGNGSTPRLVLSYDEYSNFGETIGLYQITQLFNKIGKNVILKQSRRLTVEDLKDHNAILIGSGWVNEWMGNTPIRKSSDQGPSASIINQNLFSEEDGTITNKYRAKFDEETGLLIEDYAVITVKPGISERKTIMVLAGSRYEGTQAAAEYLTDEHHLAVLNRLLIQPDGNIPKHFQVLLKVHVDNGVTTNIETVKVSDLEDSR
jgi:hypothetical protein